MSIKQIAQVKTLRSWNESVPSSEQNTHYNYDVWRCWFFFLDELGCKQRHIFVYSEISSLSLCSNLFEMCSLVDPDAQCLNLYSIADSALKERRRFNQMHHSSSSSKLLWPAPRPQKEWKITQGPESHKSLLGSARGGPISSSI